MRNCTKRLVMALLAACSASPALAATIDAASVERTAPDRLTLHWQDPDPVDVLVSDIPDAAPGAAKLLAGKNSAGSYSVAAPAGTRRYFLLRDSQSGQVARLAERVLPLQQGSNFRDVGGYPAADGKHVRWGLIYRSGGQAMLTDADVHEIRALGVGNLIDLRTQEERSIAPTRLDGIPYHAVGYTMASMMGPPTTKEGAIVTSDPNSYSAVYRTLPMQLTPQLRIVFRTLLSQHEPLVYNCSAGQDRTGFVTAMILSALGVPRGTIYADYLLSTPSRRPRWEFPPISDAMAQTSPAAAIFAQFEKQPHWETPNSLKLPDGTPFLTIAFAEIERRWGSVDGYLEHQVGLDKADLAALRATYLE